MSVAPAIPLAARMKARLIGYQTALDCVSARYFFSPELTTASYTCPLLAQRKPARDQQFMKSLAAAFDYEYQNDPMIDVDILYLSNGFEVYSELQQFAEAGLRLAQSLNNESDRYAVKFHPLSQAVLSGVNQLKSNAPFELSCLFLNMEEKLIITPISTAAFNPKFIFDQESYVALVYKLVGMDDIATRMFGISESEWERALKKALLGAYRNPERICVPQTIEELQEFIARFRRERERKG